MPATYQGRTEHTKSSPRKSKGLLTVSLSVLHNYKVNRTHFSVRQRWHSDGMWMKPLLITSNYIHLYCNGRKKSIPLLCKERLKAAAGLCLNIHTVPFSHVTSYLKLPSHRPLTSVPYITLCISTVWCQMQHPTVVLTSDEQSWYFWKDKTNWSWRFSGTT